MLSPQVTFPSMGPLAALSKVGYSSLRVVFVSFLILSKTCNCLFVYGLCPSIKCKSHEARDHTGLVHLCVLGPMSGTQKVLSKYLVDEEADCCRWLHWGRQGNCLGCVCGREGWKQGRQPRVLTGGPSGPSCIGCRFRTLIPRRIQVLT